MSYISLFEEDKHILKCRVFSSNLHLLKTWNTNCKYFQCFYHCLTAFNSFFIVAIFFPSFLDYFSSYSSWVSYSYFLVSLNLFLLIHLQLLASIVGRTRTVTGHIRLCGEGKSGTWLHLLSKNPVMVTSCFFGCKKCILCIIISECEWCR